MLGAGGPQLNRNRWAALYIADLWEGRENMSHSISTSEDGKYIILEIIGDITAEIIMKMIIEAHAIGEKQGISRYLVDGTQARNVSTITDNYQFAYDNMKSTPGINIHARVAMLVSLDDHSHDFVETVTQNAGFNAKMFRDRTQAIEYLRK